MAYKRELIINNGALTSYKKILKVSDVCQLLDKSKYPGTQTIDGVTFTNNGDGTITVNSLNITANAHLQLLPSYIDAKKGHKYCALSGTNRDGGYFYVDILNENGAWVSAIVDNLYTVPADNYSLRSTIIAEKNKPFGDKTYKPQLFDLTEMYGAGNEPATVAEFKAKFPNELYPYSPRCWVTSYKTGLIAKTKNLLTEIKPFGNTRVENGIVYQTVADTRELDTLKVQIYNGNTFLKQWSGNAQQIGKNTLTFTTDVLPAHTRVIFGLNGVTNDMTAFAPIILENNTTYTLSLDFINVTQGEMAWTNSMLEKGSTATDYVPYGYL